MHWKIGGDAARGRLRAFTRRASSILVTSSVISLAATGARAEDAAALQRLEAKMQELEARHESEIKTIVGPIAFSEDGERKETATLQAQFQGIVDNDMDQFKKPGKQVILFPEKLKSGNLITPFEAARK